jgi:hypothetical protein
VSLPLLALLLVESRVPAFAGVSSFASVTDVASIPIFVNIHSVPGVLTVPGVPAFSGITDVAGYCVLSYFFFGISHNGRGTPKNFQRRPQSVEFWIRTQLSFAIAHHC